MAKIAGGCLCGSLRYQSEAEPALVVTCQCKTCQKNSGSSFSLNLGIPEDALQVEGDTLATYEDHSGASGKAFYRHFCSRCGSHIYAGGEAYEGLVFIKAGTLDDPSWVTPAAHIWWAEKQPWLKLADDAAQVAGNPG